MREVIKSRGLFGRRYLDLQVREREIAQPGEDRVVVKVRACGVCGTDVNFVRDWKEDYMPLGHEIAAEVVEAGKNVRGHEPQRAVSEHQHATSHGYPGIEHRG